ncbi:hypothetical protein DPEC_G00303540 [Dallia pectoralis]|uniref:Uncharacterized protein n=1 Tax=Dallia pectoralis TaxID=75939 RepID=A0ACC2FDG2_DALPE|nr:hypothetical protein DPEC_G00303540 [Dallia pectoralis]
MGLGGPTAILGGKESTIVVGVAVAIVVGVAAAIVVGVAAAIVVGVAAAIVVGVAAAIEVDIVKKLKSKLETSIEIPLKTPISLVLPDVTEDYYKVKEYVQKLQSNSNDDENCQVDTSTASTKATASSSGNRMPSTNVEEPLSGKKT